MQRSKCPSERNNKRGRQKKQKSTGFNLRIKKRGSQYENVKRGVKNRELRRRASSSTEPGGVRGERREGPFIQKRLSFTYRRKKKSKRKASSRLLDAVSNPISVWFASAARLPGTGSQWRRSWAATPLTSNLHPPGQA